MSAYKTLDDLGTIRGQRALVRVDFNLPVTDGTVTDTTRIERAAPTVRELTGRGARVILMSHRGRPKGKVDPALTLEHILPAVSAILSPVGFASDCIGQETLKIVEKLNDGDILLLENTRFHRGEEDNDPSFAKALAALGDFYVNDAFSVAHRANSSTEAIAHLLPSYAGRAMAAELSGLARALDQPERPLVALVGGAKVSSKIDLLNNLVTKADALVIGGGMANTFLAALGHDVGASLCEHDLSEVALEIATHAQDIGCDILLPTDVVVAETLEQNVPAQTIPLSEIAASDKIFDVGPQTIALISQRLERAKTVIWNGPLGAFEVQPFDAGTCAVARHVAMLTQAGRVVSVAGGGDTVAALNHAGVGHQFSYISTAGGAFLEWLEGNTLPAVKALEESE